MAGFHADKDDKKITDEVGTNLKSQNGGHTDELAVKKVPTLKRSLSSSVCTQKHQKSFFQALSFVTSSKFVRILIE